MVYRIDSFQESNINPITGKEYDDTWIIYILNNEPYKMRIESMEGCAYTLKVSKNCSYWEMTLGDFLSYNNSIGKNIILVISEIDYKKALKKYKGHTCDEKFLRDYEDTVLIHSTTKENYKLIKKSGYLKSWNLLKKQKINKESEPIGKQLGDPMELRDFILFGKGTTGEIVVNSKQCRKIQMDENMEYISGARLYFDISKIAEDGLLIRDGSEIKVKDAIPLEPYLLLAATWDKIGLETEKSTPKLFAQTADKYFKDNILNSYVYEENY